MHTEQQKIWEREHESPHLLPQMDSNTVSQGVSLFWEWLQKPSPSLRGIEMGCGKGRNSIWLAEQGVSMTAFDFSTAAIREATKRASTTSTTNSPHFFVHDATLPWPFEENSFDFAIDCFASTDIDSLAGRTFARNELFRVLKPNGYLLIYTLSTDDAYHQEMCSNFPASEKNAFFHPHTQKFEKVFDEEELQTFYQEWRLVEKQRLSKTATFFNKDYSCSHFWIILQKGSTP